MEIPGCVHSHHSLVKIAFAVATAFAANVGSVFANRSANAAANAEFGRQPSRSSTAMEDRNPDIFQSFLAALGNGDFAKALSYFAPEAVVVAYGSVPFAGTYSATDGAWAQWRQKYWRFSASGIPESLVLYADCDKAISNGQFKRAALATGRTVDTRFI